MIPAIGLSLGIIIGLLLQPAVPVWLQPYLPIAVIAALDAVFGGVRAIRVFCRITGHPAPEVFHTNEGHAGFLGVERIRELVESMPGLTFDGSSLRLTRRTERCHDCPEADRCKYAMKMADNQGLRELYLDCEQHDGYYRDRCVFSADMDIEDSMNLVVDYANGVSLSGFRIPALVSRRSAATIGSRRASSSSSPIHASNRSPKM